MWLSGGRVVEEEEIVSAKVLRHACLVKEKQGARVAGVRGVLGESGRVRGICEVAYKQF